MRRVGRRPLSAPEPDYGTQYVPSAYADEKREPFHLLTPPAPSPDEFTDAFVKFPDPAPDPAEEERKANMEPILRNA